MLNYKQWLLFTFIATHSYSLYLKGADCAPEQHEIEDDYCAVGEYPREFDLSVALGYINIDPDGEIEDINSRDHEGKTALIKATEENDTECIHTLLKRGADCNILDNKKRCPLGFTALNDNKEATQLLLTYGAHANLCDAQGSSPVWVAANKGHLGIITLLLDHMPDLVNKADNLGRTPLHTAVGHGHIEAVKLLLSRHAKQVPDNKKETPFALAKRRYGSKRIGQDIMQLLRTDHYVTSQKK